MLSYENTKTELEEKKPDTAVLPIGSIEQHASHLPIGSDCILAEAYAIEVAKALDAFLLPVLPISTCYEHKCTGKFGGVWMSPKTLYQVLQDVVLSLHTQGFKRVIIILGHGGIYISAPAIRELNALYDDLLVINIMPPKSEKAKAVLENKGFEIHSGESETSLILYLREELVKKDKMLENDYTPNCPQSFLNYASIQELSPTGVWGKSSLATKEKGALLYQYGVETILDEIEEATKIGNMKKW